MIKLTRVPFINKRTGQVSISLPKNKIPMLKKKIPKKVIMKVKFRW